MVKKNSRLNGHDYLHKGEDILSHFEEIWCTVKLLKIVGTKKIY